MCLPETVVASWFVTQEVADSNTAFFAKICFQILQSL